MIGFSNNNKNSSPSTSEFANDDLNTPISSSQRITPYSPYLNFDPSYLPTSQPEFITPSGITTTGGSGLRRGQFELAFGQIGAAFTIGAGIGGTRGLIRGLKATTLAGQTGKLRRTQLINHVMKNGTSVGNSLATIAVMYSGIGVAIHEYRQIESDLNSIISATATGILLKSTAGVPKCIMGGIVGFALSTTYCIWNGWDTLSEIMQDYNMNPA
ncbi:mitochondrial import inner membrane translocase subunit Tim23-like isoform X3 [Microplitis mediator]|nr:mitochondrial import inner membrane translocase subunit Tim23-like isoform X3 [Microplitis mediator]